MEVLDGHYIAGRSDPASCRRITDLASQRELGVRAKRRARPSRLDSSDPTPDRAALEEGPYNYSKLSTIGATVHAG